MNKILGHQKIWQQLTQAQQLNRLGSALLFLGSEGIGKFLVAEQLAQLLLCENPTHEAADDTCPSCILLKQKQHPDLQVIENDGIIKIESIRQLLEQARFAPYLNKAKVIIIRDAHNMNVAASNALLKLLEEPPSQYYFILTSHSVGKILATIRSRCQKYYFQPLTQADLKIILENQNKDFPQAWLQLGSPGLILNWLKNQELTERPFWQNFLQHPQKIGAEQIFTILQEYKKCEDQKSFFYNLLFKISEQLKLQPNMDLMLLTERIHELQRMQVLNLNSSLSLEYLLTSSS